MDSEKNIINMWPTVCKLAFNHLPDKTVDFYLSKTNIIEYDFSSRTLVVGCTNPFIYEKILEEIPNIEKLAEELTHVELNINLLELSEKTDTTNYVSRVLEEDAKRSAEEQKEKEEAAADMRLHHPDYFKNPSEKEETSPESVAVCEDFSDFTDIDIGGGKKIRIGSTTPAFNPNFTFDTFIEGESNKFAKAACMAVAAKPAAGYNPLFIYGASGLGKTHLLYAIITRIKEYYPDKKVMYITCEQFMNQMVRCLQHNAMQEFKDLFRTRDVLLVDDIQFLEGKPSVQEEMFHTINAMIGKCQMIFTSDRTPSEMKQVEERLITRFEWGLLTDIQPPDLELRVALFKQKAQEKEIKIKDDVVLYLAENLRSNVRQIEGAINRFAARAFLMGKDSEIDMEYVKKCLPDLLGSDEPVSVVVDKIFAAVYEKYGVSREQIESASRTKDIAYARKISVFLIKKKCGLSVQSISTMFNRDHSTITALLSDISVKKDTDPKVMSDLNEFCDKLKIVI